MSIPSHKKAISVFRLLKFWWFTSKYSKIILVFVCLWRGFYHSQKKKHMKKLQIKAFQTMKE